VPMGGSVDGNCPRSLFAREQKGEPAMLQIAARHIRVLAVDDSLAFLRTLASFLEADPCVGVVATASSGEEALCAVDVVHPDVVLMDLQMPGRSGLETAAQLHDKYPGMPIIIITAHQMPGLREFCTQGGAVEMIPKNELVAELPRVLRSIRHSLHNRSEL
jgi:two-component system, NarL family, response regulator DesR